MELSQETTSYIIQYVFNNLGFILYIAILTIIFRVVIKCVKVIVKYRNDCHALKDFDGPPRHWFFGNIRDLTIETSLAVRMEWMRKYSPAFITKLGPFQYAVSLTSPDFMKAITHTTEPKDKFAYSFITPWIGDGLLTSYGKKWERNRRLLSPGFHNEVLKPYLAVFSSCANNMIQKLKDGSDMPSISVEIYEHVSLMTLNSLMQCIFGIDTNYQKIGQNDPYIKAVYDLLNTTINRFFFLPYLINPIFYYSSDGRKFRKACIVVHSFSEAVIKDRMENKQSNKKYLDFLDILLSCRDEDGNGLSEQEIKDEVDTFMFEGHDTTAAGISWCLYALACNKENQEKCRKEVLNVLGDRTEVTMADISHLTYLTMCIKESLRLFTPVPATGRMTTKDIPLPDGRIIPSGMWVINSLYGCHHNPNVWSDPEKFHPERFSTENSQNRHPHAFVPFSAGPRNCIGQHFAMNEMKTVIALMVKTFYLDIDEDKPAKPVPLIVLRALNGIWLKIEPIE